MSFTDMNQGENMNIDSTLDVQIPSGMESA